jgi:hypothetical protein
LLFGDALQGVSHLGVHLNVHHDHAPFLADFFGKVNIFPLTLSGEA